MRSYAAEDGWANQDAADDFPDDARLAEHASQAATDHRNQQHDRHLEQQQGHGKNPFLSIFL
jgi:hypothetical protein